MGAENRFACEPHLARLYGATELFSKRFILALSVDQWSNFSPLAVPPLVAKGIRPEMARLTLSRKIAAIALIIWTKEEAIRPPAKRRRSASRSCGVLRRGMAGGRMTASVSQHQRLGSFCFVSVSVRNLYFNLPRQIHDLFTGLPPGDFSLISPATRIPVQAPSSLK
jgi:hypothetical protein